MALAAPAAIAQQSCYVPITGPSQICGGTVELCGPAGYDEYEWTAPDGSMSITVTPCTTVARPGTYSLRTFDGLNNMWFGPCTHVLAEGSSGPAPSIDGPVTGCVGTPVRLCGPEAAEAAWTGPDGFRASTRCVDVGVAGTYVLRVRMEGDACWSLPAEHTVSFTSCDEAPTLNCPWPPSFWRRVCRDDRDPERGRLEAIARCVDERADALAWKDGEDDLCRTMARCGDLRSRARRQFAAVWANVCAGELGVMLHDRPGGLAPLTPVVLEGVSTTVGEWLAATDQRLLELMWRSHRNREAKRAYKEIIRVGWTINHGIGIGPTCRDGSRGRLTALSEGAEATPDDMTLDQELTEGTEGHLRLERVGPNPASGRVDVTFAVSPGASDDVAVGVYDLAGRLLRELARGPMQPGRYTVSWDGRGPDGAPVPNGVYFVMARVGSARSQERLTLIR